MSSRDDKDRDSMQRSTVPSPFTFTAGAGERIPMVPMTNATAAAAHTLRNEKTDLKLESQRAKLAFENASSKAELLATELEDRKAMVSELQDKLGEERASRKSLQTEFANTEAAFHMAKARNGDLYRENGHAKRYIAELQRECRHAQTLREEVQEQHETYRRETGSHISQLSEVAARHESEKKELKGKLTKKAKENICFKLCLAHRQSERQRLLESHKAAILEAEEKIKSQAKENKKLHDRMAREIDNHTSAATELNKTREGLKQTSNSHQKLQVAHKDLTARFDRLSDSAHNLREALGSVERERDDAISKIKGIGENVQKAAQICHNEMASAKAAHAEVVEKMQKSFDQEREVLRRHIVREVDDNIRYRAEAAKLEKQTAEHLQRQEFAEKELLDRTNAHTNEIDELCSEVKTAYLERDNLRLNSAHYQRQLEISTKQSSNLRIALRAWHEEREIQSDLIARLRGQVAEQTGELEHKQQELSAFEDRSAHKVKNISVEYAQLAGKMERKKEKMELLEGELEESNNRATKVAEMLRSYRLSSEANVVHYDHRHKQLEGEVQSLKSEGNGLRGQLKAAEDEVKQEAARFANLSEELADRNSKIAALDLELQEATMNVDELQNKLYDQAKHYEDRQGQLDAKIHALKTQRSELEKQYKAVERRLCEVRHRLEKLQHESSAEIALLSGEVEQRMAETEQLRDETAWEIRKLEEDRDEVQVEVNTLQMIVKDREHEIHQQIDELDDLKDSHSKASEEWLEITRRLSQEHTAEVHELQKQRKTLTAKVLEQQKFLDLRENEIYDKIAYCHEVSEGKREAETEVVKLRRAMMDQKSEMQEEHVVRMRDVKSAHEREIFKWEEKVKDIRENWDVQALD